MRKIIIFPIIYTLTFCSTLNVLAQLDSSRLDAGYLSLKREFTQGLTIKGADLEKMPFANLNEAISSWFYGAYTPDMVHYVVDGNPVSDVNAYSIHDIEEVVLVQNAAALLGAGGGQEQLVLVRTRRHKSPGGMTAAAQTGLVSVGGSRTKTVPRIYDDYYFGGYRNWDKISMGLSGNYLRDVFPLSDSGGRTITPNQLCRWRLNGYFTWRPDKHNQVDISLSYTPQQLTAALDSTDRASTFFNLKGKANQHLLLPKLGWQSKFASRWTNDLQAIYLSSRYSEYDQLNDSSTPASYSTRRDLSEVRDDDRSHHFWVRDRMECAIHAGRWQIEPALTVSYEHIEERYGYEEVMEDVSNFGTSIPTLSLPGLGPDTPLVKKVYDVLFLTPAINISYSNSLNLMAGMLVDASHRQLYPGRHTFPFVSLSVDPIHLTKPSSASSLKIFGSYAQTTLMSFGGYELSDLSRGLDLSFSIPTPLLFSDLVNSPANPSSGGPTPLPVPVYWVWEFGAAYSGWGSRLQISYNFQRQNFTTTGVGQTLIVLGIGALDSLYRTEPQWRSSLHHVDIRIKILQGQALNWQTGLNFTLLRMKADSAGSFYVNKNTVGDTYPNHYSWTGGWVNRLLVKDFTAGLDLLYHIGETVVDQAGAAHNLNSVVMPNLYAGYRWHLSHTETLECFLESRGLIRNSTSDLMDRRRYYSAGGRLSL